MAGSMTAIPPAIAEAIDRALDKLPQPTRPFERDRWRIAAHAAYFAAAPLISAARAPLAPEDGGAYARGILDGAAVERERIRDAIAEEYGPSKARELRRKLRLEDTT
jgi:hypothetical protein